MVKKCCRIAVCSLLIVILLLSAALSGSGFVLASWRPPISDFLSRAVRGLELVGAV